MSAPSGKKQRQSAQKRLAAERAAAAKARLAAQRRRQRLLRVGAPVAAIVVVVAILVIVKVTTGAGAPKSGQAATAASSTVVSDVTSVPASVLNTIGAGTIQTPPAPLTGAALTIGGKPRILYVGAEYCPYCATERWAMVIALSRFGTFTGLGQTTSSPSDVYPSTATLTFHGATYTSAYLSFTGKEIQSNQVVNGAYAPLDTLSAADQALLSKDDSARRYPVRGHRRQIHDLRRVVQPAAAAGQDARPDRGSPVRPHLADRQGRGRHRERHHRRGVFDHRQQAGHRLHIAPGAAPQPQLCLVPDPGPYPDPKPARRVPAGLVSFLIALLGAGISAYLTAEHYNTTLTLACPESATINCAKVTTSPWSHIGAIPVALLGLIFFLAMVPLS